MPSIHDLERIAVIEFADIVTSTKFIDHKLRLFLTDSSFIDVNLSQRLPDKFGFHWSKIAGQVFSVKWIFLLNITGYSDAFFLLVPYNRRLNPAL